MERLTNSIDYCQLHCDFGKKEDCFFQDKSKCYENNMYKKLREYEEIGCTPEQLKQIDEWYGEMCRELGEYKRLEEQGLILRSPCKVGDTVWCIVSAKTKAVPCIVLWIEWHRNGVVVFSLDGGLGDVVLAHLGKTWFLTKEEAEQALAEMKGV